ncbi:hypothetical protein [Saccharothrix obliqua]|uniref:hypothetical protein n=1 Tax=Saccharothrix obliqua TaxID=2861747 RepID=UPI001C5FBA25|nr:hypothetical protein [Saccharothrix obliqua]MBW4722402.1 hypothetical protein [Saccharothrix obliqua]
MRALAVYAAVQATWSDVHAACDQILQRDADARLKGGHGWSARKACARHVATYCAGQAAATVAVTRALGYRLPWSGLIVGTTINGLTHYVIDRREPLKRLLHWAGKTSYLRHATVQRRPGVVDDAGPGTALMECDQAVHRIIGVAAAAAATWWSMRRPPSS